MNRKVAWYILCMALQSWCGAVPPINLFRPSDRPLMPEPVWCNWSCQTSIAYERAFHIRAFRDDEEESQIDLCASVDKKKSYNVLQLYQSDQNALAALKGFQSHVPEGNLSQLFNTNDENGKQGLFRPRGDLSIPLNLMISHRMYFSHGLSLAFHLPFYAMELKNVCWRSLNPEVTGEQLLERDLLQEVQQSAALKAGGWKRTGIGDFVAQMTWMREYIQPKPLMQSVRVQGRLGLICPTGKRQDEDRVLAFPFGSDGAWGIQFAGGLDLTFYYTLRGGLDAEFIHLFGNNRCRRVKSASHQTDFLFLRKVPTFREFGLGQQYNVYIESYHCWRGLSLKFNYQFLRRNEDRLDLRSDLLSTRVANSAESLQDWTAHSLIAMVRYDLWKDLPECSSVKPALRGWFKWGFNGSRALVANSVGLQLDIAF
ncbi:hypothetical protein H0W26_05900 [Candidatus Dependentiae bacterium]|nr:hypothetical protein [Candidatus Dependentiae bacterium]